MKTIKAVAKVILLYAWDMELICREYGISMYLLVKRAAPCGIVTGSIEKDFYIKAGKAGWKKNEPVRSEPEVPSAGSHIKTPPQNNKNVF